MNDFNKVARQDLTSITALDLTKFIKNRGWEYQGQRGRYAHIFTLTDTTGKHTIAVPAFERLDDHAGRILDAAQTLSQVEHRSTDEVIRDLAAASNDRPRKPTPEETEG